MILLQEKEQEEHQEIKTIKMETKIVKNNTIFEGEIPGRVTRSQKKKQWSPQAEDKIESPTKNGNG